MDERLSMCSVALFVALLWSATDPLKPPDSIICSGIVVGENFPLDLSKLVSFWLTPQGVEIVVKDDETGAPVENAVILGSISSSSPKSFELRTGRSGRAFLRVSGENHEANFTVSAPGYDTAIWRGEVSPKSRKQITVFLRYDPFGAWLSKESETFSRSYSYVFSKVGVCDERKWVHVGDVENWAAPFYENVWGWKLENYWAADAYHWEVVGYTNAQAYAWVKTGTNIEFNASFGLFFGTQIGSEFYPHDYDPSYPETVKFVVKGKRVETVQTDVKYLYPAVPDYSSYFYPSHTKGDWNLAPNKDHPALVVASCTLGAVQNPTTGLYQSLYADVYMRVAETKSDWTTFEGSSRYELFGGLSSGWWIEDVRISGQSVLPSSSSSVSFSHYTNSTPQYRIDVSSGPVSRFDIVIRDSSSSTDAPRVRAYLRPLAVYLRCVRYVLTVDRYEWTLTSTRVPVYDWAFKGELEFAERPENSQSWRYYNVRQKYHVHRLYADVYENELCAYYYLPYENRCVELYIHPRNGYSENLLLGAWSLSGENVVVWPENASVRAADVGIWEADAYRRSETGWAYAGRWVMYSRPENSPSHRFENVSAGVRRENVNVFRLGLRPGGPSLLEFSVMDLGGRVKENLPFRVFTNNPPLPESYWALRFLASVPLGRDVGGISPPPSGGIILSRGPSDPITQTYACILHEYRNEIGLAHPSEDFYRWSWEVLYLEKGYEIPFEVQVKPKNSIFQARIISDLDPSFRIGINWSKIAEDENYDKYTIRIIQPSYVNPPYALILSYTVKIEVKTPSGEVYEQPIYVNIKSERHEVKKVVHGGESPWFVIPVLITDIWMSI